jgi:hypothetical protein
MWGKIKFVAILSGVIFIVLLFLSVGGYYYWSSPNFCKSCHIMRPYYESWKSSSHREVACVKCHFEPGVENELKGKWLAIKQLAAFLTGAYSSKPYAQISDKSCLRSGCHSERLISGKVVYTSRKVNFDHTPHLQEIRKGIKLSCTSCHSQIVIGSHITVTNDTCFLCHLKDYDKLTSQTDSNHCTICHKELPEPKEIAGLVVNHKSFVEKGISCTNCHIDVKSGTNEVSKDRCFHCHNELTKVEKFNDVEMLHISHVSVNKVECSRCHQLIKHTFNTSLVNSQNRDCGVCHKEFHNIQQDFYMGKGAKGIEGKPDPMFVVGIGCTACHVVSSSNIALHSASENQTLKANKYVCFRCHNNKYKSFPEAFSSSLNSYIATFDKILPALEGNDKNGLLKQTQTKFNLDLLKLVKAIHNPFYSTDIIKKSFDDISEIVKLNTVEESLKVEFEKAKKHFEDNLCLICHKSLPTKETFAFQQKAFPHTKHIEELELKCNECHKIDMKEKLSSQHPPKISDTKVCEGCH